MTKVCLCPADKARSATHQRMCLRCHVWGPNVCTVGPKRQGQDASLGAPLDSQEPVLNGSSPMMVRRVSQHKWMALGRSRASSKADVLNISASGSIKQTVCLQAGCAPRQRRTLPGACLQRPLRLLLQAAIAAAYKPQLLHPGVPHRTCTRLDLFCKACQDIDALNEN